MRRFTRLTNAFSKKVENHEHSVALHFFHYNFCRVHQSLRVTPAMEAEVSRHVWGLDELVGLLDRKRQLGHSVASAGRSVTMAGCSEGAVTTQGLIPGNLSGVKSAWV